MSFIRRNWFLLVLILLVGLNIFDAVSSHYVISHGFASEVNPVMAWLWNLGPVYFHGFKALSVAVGVAVAWRHRHQNGIRTMVVVIAIAYEALFWYQVYSLLTM